MVTTEQKPILDSQKIKRRKSEHTLTKNQFTKKGIKRGKNSNGITKEPENN